jgi:inner membrane protein
VDNLCHTLVGAACGEAGLKRRTALGSITLMISANLPDIDVLVFATSLPSVAFRRGWTHGVLAQVLLPIVFAALMTVIGRSRKARFAPLLLLSYVGVLTHVALDLLNNYGVRLLMPFSNRWFYGDAVFIVDVWLWMVLGLGVALSFAHHTPRAARTSLAIATAYVLAMVISARVARVIVADEWRAAYGASPRAFMVGPEFFTPFARRIIVDAGDRYVTGQFRFPRHIEFDSQPIRKQDNHPAVARAKAVDRRVQAVLVWARFPYFEVEQRAGVPVVRVRDVRFGPRVGSVTAIVND